MQLPKPLEDALIKAKEVADKNGYFEVDGDATSRRVFGELTRLGYVKQVSSWTGFDFIKVSFCLEDPAYFYDDYKAEINMKTDNTSKENEADMAVSDNIFIVHGHDDEAISKTENFIRKLGLVPIILRDQASIGKTIIEKIESYTDVGFAIILYTPCDEMKNGEFRARQNVVFEHGYLMNKLGRDRVAPLVKGSIETPGDISGVVYIEMDNGKDWEIKLVKELHAVGYKVDANNL